MAIKLTRVDEFAVLTIEREQALNALSFSLIAEIGSCLKSVAQTDARALFITGAGTKAFCAGADIGELTGRDLEAQKRGAELGQQTFALLDKLPMPSIALINGYAFGGGLELALACSFRLAARKTFITVDGITQPAPAPRFSHTPAREPVGPREVDADSTLALLQDWFGEQQAAQWASRLGL